MPGFRKLGEAKALDSTTKFVVPQEATHVGVWSGKIAFFASSDCLGDYRSRSKWKYFRLEPGVRYTSFPNYTGPGNGGGSHHNYGEPHFHEDLEIRPKRLGILAIL